MAVRRRAGSSGCSPPQRDSFPYPPRQLLTLPLKKGDEIPPQGFHRRGGNVSKRFKGSEVVVQRPKIALQGLLRPPGVPALDRFPQGSRNLRKALSQDHPRIRDLVDQILCPRSTSNCRHHRQKPGHHCEKQPHERHHRTNVICHRCLARTQFHRNSPEDAPDTMRRHLLLSQRHSIDANGACDSLQPDSPFPAPQDRNCSLRKVRPASYPP